MDEISVSICYCPVFDDCHEWGVKNAQPEPVDQCTLTPGQLRFRPNLRKS